MQRWCPPASRARAGARGCRSISMDFVGSIERMAWAEVNGCPWVAMTCALVARGRLLDVQQWARDNHCPMDVLQWVLEQHPPGLWGVLTCSSVASSGQLGVLKWIWERGCPLDRMTCACAANGGNLELLKWARAAGLGQRERVPVGGEDVCTRR